MGVQTLGFAVLQLQPVSRVQVPEQPSPGVVSPSSQVSAPCRTPLPQMGVQTLGEAVVQVQPNSTLQ